MNTTKSGRRRFLKTTAAGAAVGAVATLGGAQATAAEARKLRVAGYDYDRVRGIMDGRIGIDGFDVEFQVDNIYSVNDLAFGDSPKYDVSELGLIPYITKFINEDFRGYTLVPVFISRTFRHRNIYVRSDAGIETPEDLSGKRVGTPGYGMSANTWIRGFLLDEYGVAADDMQWIETTRSSDAGKLSGSGWSAFEDGERSRYLPADFPIEQGPPNVDESELLLSGECDALITAITPRAFASGDPRIRQLFPNPKAAEQAYFTKTGLFPIMHCVGIRADAITANPGLPKAVFEMYSAAKRIAYADLDTTTALKVSLPWVEQEFEATQRLMGANYWPYGIEANRRELDSIMRYVHEQGLVGRRVAFEDLFHPSTLELIEREA